MYQHRHHGSLRREERGAERIFERIMAFPPQSNERHESTHLSLMNSKYNTPEPIEIRLSDKNLKSSKNEATHHFQVSSIILIANFSAEIMEASK